MICPAPSRGDADGWAGGLNTDTASAEGAHADFHVVKLNAATLREHEAENNFIGAVWFRAAVVFEFCSLKESVPVFP